MAILRVYASIRNDVYILRFENDLCALSEGDRLLMKKFGEPTINVGGTFGVSPDVFTLPNEYIRIVSDFPYTRMFDSRDAAYSTDTVIKVDSYRTAIIAEFNTAITTLRSNSDTFSGETVDNI